MEFSLACSGPSGLSGTVFAEGDQCILFNARTQAYRPLVLTPGNSEPTAHSGHPIRHSMIIGQAHGSRILVPGLPAPARRGRRGRGGRHAPRNPPPQVYYALAYDAHAYAAAAPMRTQVLYQSDIGRVLGHLALGPGATVIEAGTGSGVLTRHLSAAVGPKGRVCTFEFNEARAKAAAADFAGRPELANVTVTRRDVQTHGFSQPGTVVGFTEDGSPDPEAAAAVALAAAPAAPYADALFLDVPVPAATVDHIMKTVRPGGRIIIFSPCVEQLTAFLDAASLHAAALTTDEEAAPIGSIINARVDVAQARNYTIYSDALELPDVQLVPSRRAAEAAARRQAANRAAAPAPAPAEAGAARAEAVCPYPLPDLDVAGADKDTAAAAAAAVEVKVREMALKVPAVREFPDWALPSSSSAHAQAERLHRSHTGFLLYAEVAAPVETAADQE